MKRDARDAGLRDEPLREREAARVARAQPRAKLDRHGDSLPRALHRSPRQRDREVRLGEQLGAGARPPHLRYRASHVDVDRVRSEGRDVGGRFAHHGGVLAEQLDRDWATGALTRVDPQHLVDRARVAMADRV